MCRFTVYVLLVFAAHQAMSEITAYEVNNSSENEIMEKPFTWLKGVQNIVSSPAGHVAVQMAKELINRSAGNSQVLSLNLTNLLIIILLKILIFAAGMLGAGHWGGYGYGYGRSIDRSSDVYEYGLNEGEAYLITGFLAAQGAGIDDCLYAAACESPKVAYEYAKAAKALMEGIKKFENNSFSNPRYNDLLVLVEKAAHDGYRGVPCNTTFKCDGLL
ncbi:uncharacterized protein LOC119676360 [Teleopsis dalmanni]|uniref:uncharacterized protein LOC119676360 n=1 Tax=Teleopsis dalmanni TaxID=139649 RepID=UPI0018CE643E|nr:uncharacterized protein LOC119676360 [Teleopsis dalmanni]